MQQAAHPVEMSCREILQRVKERASLVLPSSARLGIELTFHGLVQHGPSIAWGA
jgi:hypothetical protein